MMKITVLGSGGWEGIPAPFCHCRVCKLAIRNPGSKNNRTRPQFLIETKKGIILLEISPDIRLQSTRIKTKLISDFLVSHWHFDHLQGLKELHTWSKKKEKKPIVYCSMKTSNVIEKEFSYIPIKTKVLQPFKRFSLKGVMITPLVVYHMYGEDKELPKKVSQNVFGYLFEHNGERIAYLSDYYHVPEDTIKLIENVDVLIADGTYLGIDQYKDIKLNHLHGDEIISFAKHVGARRVYYFGVSHVTGRTHQELQKILPASHYLTYDGLNI